MKTNDSPSQSKRDGLKLFVVLVAMISIAMGVTIAISDENDADNGDLYFTEGDFCYKSTDGVNSIILKCSDVGKNKRDLVIPDEVTHNGKVFKVTEIEDCAFKRNDMVINTKIGDNVTRIGHFAFSACNNLERLVIGKNIGFIGDCAFCDCPFLFKVVMGSNNVYIGEWAFSDCGSLKKITWPEKNSENGVLSSSNDGLTIGNGAFKGCALETVDLPENTISIGKEAFYGNKELDTVVIPGSVETIGDCAFGDCPIIDKFAFGNFADEVEFGDHIFSYEDESKGTVDYKFRNMDGKEYTFTDAAVESGVFDNRAYDVDENGTALNVFGLLLDANGGTCDDNIAFTDENGVLLTALPKPVRDGYTFVGWYDGDEKVGVGSVFTDNTTLTAKWAVAQPADSSSTPLLILLLLVIIAIVGIAVIPRKE